MSLGAAADAALSQVWPPFVLVAGLLTIGVVADAEGVFAAAAGAITRVSSRPMVALLGLLGLTAVTSALLNLDTAAAFLTPVLILAARQLDTDDAPFLYGAVLMANAGSLFLLGSNLTNLLVLGHGSSGGSFFARMLPAAIVSVLVTGAGLLIWARHRRRARPGRPASSPSGRPRSRPGSPLRPGPALLAIPVAAGLIVALRNPALPVLAVAVVVGALALRRGTVGPRALWDAVGPLSLLGLLGLAVALGTLAREWSGPEHLLAGAGDWATAGLAAGASVLINNLPAATLLSAHRLAHPGALLIGLDLGPNLAVSGSLSVLIWWRGARRLGASPSVATYSGVGIPLALLAAAAALAALSLTT